MKTVVVGHNNSDIDSIVSAIFEAKRQIQNNVDAEAYVAKGKLSKGTKEVLDYLGVEIPKKWNSKLKDNPTILVDYNTLVFGPEGLTNIISVIDHHSVQPWTNTLENKTIKEVGATATLVAEKYLQNATLTRKEAKILLFTIMADSKNLTSSKTKDEDRDLIKYLEKLSGFSAKKANRIINKYSFFKYDKKQLKSYMKEDIKKAFHGKISLVSGELMTANYKPFYNKHKLIQENFKYMLNGDIKVLAIQDLKHKKTVIISNKTKTLSSPIMIDDVIGRRQISKLIIDKKIIN